MTDNATYSRQERIPRLTCTYCGGNCHPTRINFTVTRSANSFALIRDVPAEVCQDCGEPQFALTVAQRISSTVNREQAPDDIAIVPIYDFTDNCS